MSCNITNNLLSSFFSFLVSAFSSCAGITVAPDRKPNNALKSLTSFAGTAFRGPLA